MVRTPLGILVVLGAFCLMGQAFETKTLVILDDPSIPQSHSIFFKNLQNRGHKLSFLSAKDRHLRMGKFGEFDYDNLILFSPNTEDFGGDFDVEHMRSFINSGRNALVVVDTKLTETNREIANECGVDFDEKDTMVIDHVAHDVAHEQVSNTRIIASVVPSASSIVGKIDAPILYSGMGHAVNENSNLVFNILTGSPTAYSHKPSTRVEEYPQSAGADALLVTAVQARNDARIVFTASKDLFGNKFFRSPVQNAAGGKKYARTGNEEFADALTKWTFGEKGVLRTVNFTHHAVGSNEMNPGVYRIKDNVAVSVTIQEFDSSADAWVPYKADDVQLEFTMLDPYVRITLKDNGDGLFSTQFKAPDVYGVYKFIIDYQRVGYSSLKIWEQVSLRPYYHNEYQRFLLVAYPYYASAFSLMAGFYVFGVYFLYGTYPGKQ